jgi:hypothetical protein
MRWHGIPWRVPRYLPGSWTTCTTRSPRGMAARRDAPRHTRCSSSSNSNSNPQRTDYVFQGTQFERAVATALEGMGGFTVLRCGGAGDRGVDLRARLTPPGIPVLVQCKLVTSPLGPRVIRELEGTALAALPTGPGLALLVSNAPCTPRSKQALMASRLPMGAVVFAAGVASEPQQQQQHFASILLNPAAQSAWPGLVVATKQQPGRGAATTLLFRAPLRGPR